MDALMQQRNAVDERLHTIAVACEAHHEQWTGIASKAMFEVKAV